MERQVSAYIYGLFPIDFGWNYLPLFSDIEEGEACETSRCYVDVRGAREMFIHATPHLINEMSWEGDFRIPMHAMLLPTGDCNLEIALVWKQSNNGNCFIVSPKPLAWLEKEAYAYKMIEYSRELVSV